jgi:hypothetical protein
MVAPTTVDTVLVENSDDRLAAVEEAKRTGQPFQSVAANKTEIVPYEVAFKIADDKAQENTYVRDNAFGLTYAGHLESYHEKIKDPEFVHETNEDKARAHHDYSAELVRRQMEDEAMVQEMKAQGFDPSVAVQQANLERAREHEVQSAEYMGIRDERDRNSKPVLAIIDEAVNVLRAEDVADKPFEERAAALLQVTNVPDAMEHPAQDALVTKDKIIETAESYEAHAMQHDQLRERDRPGISIMESAGSPEELREKTALAQAYADNPTPEAAKAVREVEEAVEEAPTEEKNAKPGKVLAEAEATVEGGRDEADEMKENPSK